MMIKEGRIFAFGDLHGHYDEFQELLELLKEKADFSLEKDHLVLLGDLVDSGPKSKEIVSWCRKTEKQFPQTLHVICGNHENLLLDAFNPRHPKYGDYYIWYNQGGEATLKSFIPKDLDEYQKAIMQPEDAIGWDNIQWLANLPYYWQTDEYFFVHGGLPPRQKIEDMNLDDPYIQDQMIWIREQFYTSKWDFGKKVIFGHTSFTDRNGMFKTYQDKYKIGINTKPRTGMGYLTALELPSETFYTCL